MDCPKADLKENFKKRKNWYVSFIGVCNDDFFRLPKCSPKIRKNTKDLCKEALTAFLIKYIEQTNEYATDT